MKDKKTRNLIAISISFLFITTPILCFAGGGREEDASEGEDTEIEEYTEQTEAFTERRDDRLKMVETQIVARGIRDPEVLEAMRTVPRHLFIPETRRRQAYGDHPIPIGEGQTISQPYIVAYMTELLEIEPGDKVLEIGTGSGYQAAVLAEITPEVYTIEIITNLAESAEQRLSRLGYDQVEIKNADGYYGWEEHGPFSAIIVTAAAGHIPPPLLDQLAEGGRMVIPVGPVYQVQTLMLVTKDQQGDINTEQLMPVRFVPMTGQAQR